MKIAQLPNHKSTTLEEIAHTRQELFHVLNHRNEHNGIASYDPDELNYDLMALQKKAKHEGITLPKDMPVLTLLSYGKIVYETLKKLERIESNHFDGAYSEFEREEAIDKVASGIELGYRRIESLLKNVDNSTFSSKDLQSPTTNGSIDEYWQSFKDSLGKLQCYEKPIPQEVLKDAYVKGNQYFNQANKALDIIKF
jgi:hypothetical protein